MDRRTDNTLARQIALHSAHDKAACWTPHTINSFKTGCKSAMQMAACMKMHIICGEQIIELRTRSRANAPISGVAFVWIVHKKRLMRENRYGPAITACKFLF